MQMTEMAQNRVVFDRIEIILEIEFEAVIVILKWKFDCSCINLVTLKDTVVHITMGLYSKCNDNDNDNG